MQYFLIKKSILIKNLIQFAIISTSNQIPLHKSSITLYTCFINHTPKREQLIPPSIKIHFVILLCVCALFNSFRKI